MKKHLIAAASALLLFSAIATFPSCGDDDEPTTCDTTDVSYASDIAPIIASSCAGVDCHTGSSPGSGKPFNDYAGVKAEVDAQRFYGSVAHLQGFSPMPRKSDGTATKLDDCKIAQIKAGVDAGAPNN
jgi:hypothetical protein